MLIEGVYDPFICKAVIVVGGPGSGKNYIATQVFGGMGLKEVDSDYAFEYLLRKSGHTGDKMDLSTMGDYKSIRDKASYITSGREASFIDGRLGLVFAQTGADYTKVKKTKEILESVGYDVYCLVVNTELDTAIDRNAKRKRTVPTNIVVTKWKAVQNNLGEFQRMFNSDNFIIFDNTNPSTESLKNIIKVMTRKIKSPIENTIGKEWIQQQKQLKNRN